MLIPQIVRIIRATFVCGYRRDANYMMLGKEVSLPEPFTSPEMAGEKDIHEHTEELQENDFGA